MSALYSHREWRPIPGYEGYYEINAAAVVRSVTRKVPTRTGTRTYLQREIKTRLNNCGYLEVRLSKNGKTTSHPLHALLAKAFLPNPENKPEVNHENGIKTDNRLENLSFMSHKENMQHASRHGLLKVNHQYKGVVDFSTGVVFKNARQAAYYYSLKLSTCKNYLNGNRPNPTPLRYYDGESFLYFITFIRMSNPLMWTFNPENEKNKPLYQWVHQKNKENFTFYKPVMSWYDAVHKQRAA